MSAPSMPDSSAAAPPPAKKRIKTTDKGFKTIFKFEWDASEDTGALGGGDAVSGGGGGGVGSALLPLEAMYTLPPLAKGGSGVGGALAALDPLERLELRRRARAAEAGGGAGAGAGAGGGMLPPTASSSAGMCDDIDDGVGGQVLTHWSARPLGEMTERDWRIMREDFDIHIKGGHPVHPLRTWAEAGMHPTLLKAIEGMGYTSPTPIQRQAIPMGLHGRDLIGIAETGSGKTAAFLIPLLSYILSQPSHVRVRVDELGPLAVILAPTRELAQQIEEECVKVSKHAGVKSVSVVGGVDIGEQTTRLRNGCDVVIGTPGRLIDCLEQSYLVLHQCMYVILDEADRMIDLGFEPQVSSILERMGAAYATEGEGGASGVGEGGAAVAPPPPSAAAPVAAPSVGGAAVTVVPPVQRRTTHMFTATMPAAVERLAKRFLTSPATVRIGDQDSGKNRRITQELIFCAGEAKKKAKLIEKLRSLPRPCIVFVNAKKQCDVIAREIEMAGFVPAVLHSGKAQDMREGALADFKSGLADVLVATDVAGRGLDIPDVAAVLNYDMASDIDRYSHRIGRTGRAGKAGLAITFLCDDDTLLLPQLKAYLESTGQPVPVELTQRLAGGADGGRREKVQFARK